MTKDKFFEMGYQELNNGELDTLFKKFDNGNVYFVQFNLEKQEDYIGLIYLTKGQMDIIKGL